MPHNGHINNGYTEPINPSYYSDDEDEAPLVFKRTSVQNIPKNPNSNPNLVKRPSSLTSQNNTNQRPKITSNPNSSTKNPNSSTRNPNSRPNLNPCQSNAKNPSNEKSNSANPRLSSNIRPNPNSNSGLKPVRPNSNSNPGLKLTSSNHAPNKTLPNSNSNSNSNLNLKKEDLNSSEDDSIDAVPLSQRLKKPVPIKIKTETETRKRQNETGTSNNCSELKRTKITVPVKREREIKSESDSDDFKPLAKRAKEVSVSSPKKPIIKKPVQIAKKPLKNSKFEKGNNNNKKPPGSGEGKKWTTLVHNGVIFPPPYKPHGVKMLYNGQPVDLTPEQEEVATMFGVMMETDYAKKPKFIENFMHDWTKILGKDHVIKKFELCNFTPIYEWHQREKEKKKQMTSEEKKAIKEEKLKQEEKYMYALVDGVKEKVGNFRVEPPGLFRGRGEHPKMGKLKKRIRPSDITINIGKDAPIPECHIPGEKWREVRHDNTVTWLAYWNDPISTKDIKYVFLAASSSLKGVSDKQKYEKARLLKEYIHKIRENYTRDFNSKDATRRQTAVATYLIDKLALRAGNDKDDDEADTVGCCTLKVENVICVPTNKLQFDFLGKDSIRYFNIVEVELPVYKAIEDFRTSKNRDGRKKKGDDLFDMIDTSILNTHLKQLMPNLTAKVFRTYNASITLDQILNKETEEGTVQEKIAVYQRANKEVALICNHQRSVSKSHGSQMDKLNGKIDELKAEREELEEDLNRAKKGKSPLKDKDGKPKRNLSPEAIEKKLAQIDARIEKMELDKTVKEDLKTVALGTSKVNYLDPRISVAWCKRHDVPIEKIFNKSLLAKFAWAMDVDPEYRF